MCVVPFFGGVPRGGGAHTLFLPDLPTISINISLLSCMTNALANPFHVWSVSIRVRGGGRGDGACIVFAFLRRTPLTQCIPLCPQPSFSPPVSPNDVYIQKKGERKGAPTPPTSFSPGRKGITTCVPRKMTHETLFCHYMRQRRSAEGKKSKQYFWEIASVDLSLIFLMESPSWKKGESLCV